MSSRKGRRTKKTAGHSQQKPATPTPEDEVIDAEVENATETAVATTAPSRGALGDLYTPSQLALLSDEAFTERLEVLKLEQQRIEDVKRAILVEDTAGDGSGDYGLIPGTKKPSLYQSGAEKFNRLFALRPVYRRKRFAGDGEKTPHFRYLVECDLVDTNGAVHGTGAGTCSNFEVKYRYRNAALTCPDCGADEIRVSKFADSEGFYCWRKPEKGAHGCGAQFGPDDQRLISQTVGRKENPDPHDIENTVQQMADKRAYVKVTRTTHALSNTFTQEGGAEPAAGDTPPPDEGEGEEKRAQRAGRTTATPPQIKAIRDRILAKLGDFADSGITAAEIEAGIAAQFEVEKLEDLTEAQVPEAVKAVFAWEPPGS
jgi:hypothetical protein